MSAFVQGYALLLVGLGFLVGAAAVAMDSDRPCLAAVLVAIAVVLLCGGIGYVWLIGEVAS